MRANLYEKLELLPEKDKGDLLQAIFGLMEIAEDNSTHLNPKDFFTLIEMRTK
ncbi:hypothetical protein PQ478_08805 [Alkalihalophilus pseudofirmus]|uniref:hypothetical protein n=1 Tax=Alkalihalophilus pseudofirmus TaxID=79885 RepID=UPI00259BD789|nr:hypothetical protein [Alkalihalophilus pseudofirmus]WEG18569.1 hypothetical protein PQ478_08805 [Alkalihalophilus pseudofirmus]